MGGSCRRQIRGQIYWRVNLKYVRIELGNYTRLYQSFLPIEHWVLICRKSKMLFHEIDRAKAQYGYGNGWIYIFVHIKTPFGSSLEFILSISLCLLFLFSFIHVFNYSHHYKLIRKGSFRVGAINNAWIHIEW